MTYPGFDEKWLAARGAQMNLGTRRMPVVEREQVSPPTVRATEHPEEDEQVALFEWANLMLGRYPELAALVSIPNGAYLAGTEKQRWAQMARLKKAGLKPGVSDMCLPVKRGRYGSLWVEMKAPGKLDNLSEAQREWGVLMERVGNKFVVADTFEKARDAILAYLRLE